MYCSLLLFFALYTDSTAIGRADGECITWSRLVLCVLIAVQEKEMLVWFSGIPAIMLFFISEMIRNHRMLLTELANEHTPVQEPYSKAIIWILKSNVFIKFPLLLVISIPVLLFLSLVLYVFGQRPDSAIRAFTETYKHGFATMGLSMRKRGMWRPLSLFSCRERS